MSDKHGLRTTGRVTGNFGRNKVQGKRESLDLSQSILTRENLQIPSREQAFAKLKQAYELSTDPKTKATLWEMIRSREATLRPVKTQSTVIRSPYWEDIKRVR